MKRTKFSVPAVLSLAAIFLLVNGALLVGGIRPASDTIRYTQGAENLLRGGPLSAHETTVLGYISVVALCKTLGAGLLGVIAVQLVFAALTVAAQYDLGKHLGGFSCGCLAAFLLAANPDIARWNGYILTDSLYTSLLTIALWSLYQATQRKGFWYVLASVVVIFAASIRPHSWILLPVAASYWILSAPVSPGKKSVALASFLVCASLAALLLPPLINGVRGNLEAATGAPVDSQENIASMMSQGMVVWGYKEWDLKMPPAESKQLSATAYFAHHPGAVLRLFATRVGASLAHVRPFYSKAHNALVVAYYFPLYIFAVIGFVGTPNRSLCWLLGAAMAGNLLFVALTWADWDGRFLNYILPSITVLGACGMTRTYEQWKAKLAH